MKPHKRLGAYFMVALSAMALFAMAQSVHAQHPAQLVETLQVEGNRRLSDEEILSHIKTRPGDTYSQKQVLADLQSLLEWGVFDKTQTSVSTEAGLRGGVVVTFSVDELPLILEVKFKGLRGVEESEVLQALRENKINLTKGEVYDPVKIRAAVRIIRKFFASRGWPDTSVTVRSEVGGTYASLEFLIGDER